MRDELKTPPKDLDAEVRVLGAMLLEDDAIMRTSDILSVADFYSEKHRRLYDAILDCYQLEGKTDIVTVVERLRQKQDKDALYPTEIVCHVPTAANIRRDAKLVAQKALYRRIQSWAHGLFNQAQEGVEDLRAWFSEIQQGVIALSDTIRERRSPHIADVLQDLRQQWRDFKEAKENPQAAVKGKVFTVPLFKPFNAESPLPYLMPGHLWFLAGYTSAGKSTALAQILCDTGQQRGRMLLFSLEEGRTTKAVKMIANLSDIPQRYLLTGEIESVQMELVKEAEEILKGWGMIVYDDVRTLDEIILKSRKHKMQHGIDLIAIDYVQNIIGNGNSIYQDMRHIGPQLLDLAGELQVPVVALSQVTNESMRGESDVIGLKGAGELAAAADVVVWLRRKRDDDRALDAEIQKNRPFGNTGIVELQFSQKYTRIERRS